MSGKPETLVELFEARVGATPNRVAYCYPSDHGWQSLTWWETSNRVRQISSGLISLGVEPGDRVAIMASTSIDWILVDLGIAAAGAATVAIYPSTKAEEAEFILTDSGCKLVFVESKKLIDRLDECSEAVRKLPKIVFGDAAFDHTALIDLEIQGLVDMQTNKPLLSKIAGAMTGDTLATLIYTSGTTGTPKGVELTHANWVYLAEAQANIGLLSEDDVQLLWLPLAHSFGKVLTLGHIRVGFVTAVDGRPEEILKNLSEIRPTFMAAPPRVYEKVMAGVLLAARGGSIVRRVLFNLALDDAMRQGRDRRDQGRPYTGSPVGLSSLILKKVRERFGGRMRMFISGGAALSADVSEFFDAIGVPVLQGYGLTETSGGTVLTGFEDHLPGFVGSPLPGSEVMIAEPTADFDFGEILLRGPGVMRGYHGRPDLTAEVIDDKGWFHTGDLGEIVDGNLCIRGRKKEQSKLTTGKYVTPSFIETSLAGRCPYAAQVVVVSDGRKFCAALISLDSAAVMSLARGSESYDELIASTGVRAVIQSYVDTLNSSLNPWERIVDFDILPRELTIEDGELTPSNKVKRAVVEAKYRSLIEAMYA